MTGYSIAAFPTVYAGRRYRSRLEARWAAFFDVLGWQHEYEPIDLGFWSPDFLLRGSSGQSVLVEVKPSDHPTADVATKMARARASGRVPASVEHLVVLGVSPRRVRGLPWVIAGYAWKQHAGDPASGRWVTAPIGYVKASKGGARAPDLVLPDNVVDHLIVSRKGALSGIQVPVRMNDPQSLSDAAIHAWAMASNTVQWQPRGSRT